jgi:formylglycine-generating enzyme required for sulfatase activity
MPTTPLKTFIIYARADAVYKDELLAHLHLFVENELIEKWVDSDLLPGEDWEKTIERELEAAHLVLMLVSADALRSEFIRKKELKTALEKKRAGNARVVPILVRDCMWKLHADLSEIQLLPKDENGRIRGVSGWVSRDSAWTSVCDELYTLILELRSALEKGAAEEARRAAEEAEKHRQHAEQERTERSRHRRDEAFWKTVLADTAATDDLLHKIALYESYLHDPDFQNHRAEAEEAAEEVQAELDTAERRKAAQETALRKREEIERQNREAEAADKKRQAEEAARKKALPDMVFVQGGTFQMGSPNNDTEAYSDEKPQHEVTVRDFEIGKYPVTQKLWQEIMGANPSHFKGCDDCPVENVSWDDVQEFLKKLNTRYPGKTYRLPTEAEWEYAARGGRQSKGFVYAGSNDLKEVGWFSENSGSKTHPVGGKNANELGLHDMSGNVWEWCGDWYGTYPSGDQTNPTGPTEGSYRVGRGGSWGHEARRCRVSRRDDDTPDYRGSNLGFRLASSPQ